MTYDGAANDGDSGDADNVGSDTENVVGSPYADVIGGSAAANSIVAGAGSDTVDVRGDTAIDQVDCGTGFDSALADAADLLLGDAAGRCESVDQPGTEGTVISGTGSGTPTANTGTGTGTGGGATPADTKAPAIVISGLKSSYKRASFLRGITPSLAADEDVQFRVSLRMANVLLVEKAMPYGTGARKLPLKASRKAIGARKRFSATLRVEAIDRSGNSSVATRKVKVS